MIVDDQMMNGYESKPAVCSAEPARMCLPDGHEEEEVKTIFPVIDKKKTGRRLYYCMKANGLTPKDIQDYLSLSCVQTVYRWFEGVNIPTIDNLYALSQLFRVRLDDIIAGNREMRTSSISMQQKKRLYIYGETLGEIMTA